MNNLSWLLYFGGAAEGLQIFLGVSILCAVFAGGVYCIAYACEYERKPPLLWKLVCSLLIAGLLCALLPSQKTVYMIAASEMGQRVAQTDDAKEMFDLLRKKVKEVLKEKIP